MWCRSHSLQNTCEGDGKVPYGDWWVGGICGVLTDCPVLKHFTSKGLHIGWHPLTPLVQFGPHNYPIRAIGQFYFFYFTAEERWFGLWHSSLTQGLEASSGLFVSGMTMQKVQNFLALAPASQDIPSKINLSSRESWYF